MREKIGEVAGRLWKTLGKKGEMSVSMLPKTLKESSDLAFESLGWLAKEEKVMFFKKADKEYVSLTDHERNIFKSTQIKH